MSAWYTYEDRLRDHYLAYQLLKRKLRPTFVKAHIKTISQHELKAMYYAIHFHGPSNGQLPLAKTIPASRESFLYLTLFLSIYQITSKVDTQSQLDVPAILFAWDYFHRTFEHHIAEERPYGKVRPANFNEAWVIAQGMREGQVVLKYCPRCRHNFSVFYESKFRPVCQLCELADANVNSFRPNMH